MRKAVSESLETDYSKITFARTNSGKPYLVGEHEGKINFNVSHNGDFCVIASELNFPIGIDVMKIENRGNYIQKLLLRFMMYRNIIISILNVI